MKSITANSIYLTLYNVAAMVGWGMVLANVVQHYRAGDSAQVLWADVGQTLVLVQTSAALGKFFSFGGERQTEERASTSSKLTQHKQTTHADCAAVAVVAVFFLDLFLFWSRFLTSPLSLPCPPPSPPLSSQKWCTPSSASSALPSWAPSCRSCRVSSSCTSLPCVPRKPRPTGRCT